MKDVLGINGEMPKMGILQGRLSSSTNGQLQCFPQDWAKEFELACQHGLVFIELLLERDFYPPNPLWYDHGVEQIREVSERTGVAVQSICVDYCMSHPLFSESKLIRNTAMDSLKDLIPKAKTLGASYLVLPFFEWAELKTETDHARLVEVLKPLHADLKRYGVVLAIESSLSAGKLQSLMQQFPKETIGVCYDTGNTTSLGHDVPGDIHRLGSRIVTVHIKDRPVGGQNVLLGEGDADFPEIFKAFSDIGYSGAMILETQRGNDPLETADKHLAFVHRHLEAATKGKIQ